jgi:hypothetical protein
MKHAACALLLLAASDLAASAAAGELRIEPYTVETDDGRMRVPAELGRLLVPENRGDPKSRTIELAFVRSRGRVARTQVESRTLN